MACFPGARIHRAAVAAGLCLLLANCTGSDPMIEKVEAFRAARDEGDHEKARDYLSDDPRVWYEKREGEGSPVKLGAGRWKIWDEHFRGESDLEPWRAEGNAVWSIATETNDYYRLLERETVSRYRVTYFFDDDGKIEGYMISAARPGKPREPVVDRFDEFMAWALENHSEEWAYLRPGGKLDPTGDRAPRTRRLLNAWREEVGLPALQ